MADLIFPVSTLPDTITYLLECGDIDPADDLGAEVAGSSWWCITCDHWRQIVEVFAR